jgi:O-methyltransferase
MSNIIDIKDSLMQLPTFSAELHSQIISRDDYFRYATLGLAVQRIVNDNIKGSFAEVGVYQGTMSAFIHSMARERTYYLFDTFEGFPKKDVEFAGHADMFKDTSVELVLENIGDRENIVVRKGYVPDTFAGLEYEQFAFVLLDLDLYLPTARSLAFFYPRLVTGGYLVVHDYNNPPDPTILVNRAVNEFMQHKPEKGIEIADKWGSIIVRKF